MKLCQNNPQNVKKEIQRTSKPTKTESYFVNSSIEGKS